MRAHLSRVLDQLDGPMPDPGLGLDAEARAVDVKRDGPLWDLGIKLARELGTEVDPAGGAGGSGGPAAPARRRGRPRKVDFGGE